MGRLILGILTLLLVKEPLLAADGYQLLEMGAIWTGSNSADGAEYLNDEERDALSIRVEDGRLFQELGELDCQGIQNGSCQYVMLGDGRIIVSRRWQMLVFEHHCLSAEQPVVSAGSMSVENGTLISINDFSAQYISKDHYPLKAVVMRLKNMGLDISKVRVKFSVDAPLKY